MLLALICVTMSAWSQNKKTGDYIESFSNNVPTGMIPRVVQYFPEGDAFSCVNGKNRYTRALYGSNTDYRIETSDVPIFALYKQKVYRNVRFVVGGVQLETAQYCKAQYGKGRRHYVVRDDRWGKNAVLSIECVMMPTEEGGYWKFDAKGFDSKTVNIKVLMCNIANPKLRRNGDMGADKAGSFDPSPVDEGLTVTEATFSGTAIVQTKYSGSKEEGHLLNVVTHNKKEFAQTEKAFAEARSYFEEMSERIKFITPDPYINTIGSAMTLAADGAWDGETWLHGAIGWRMPLAGWRAGYLGDVLGWNDRAVKHFNAYANSQVTDVEPTIDSPTQDKANNLARAEKKWGTQMYSNGYICRNPNKKNIMHHYDMNLNYIDELLWHFQYDADTTYMKKMWPVLKSHLAWEKRNFDKDNDGLYDAYCCIWASDALYYNGGGVTHSSAYNYRGNALAAKIATLIGEDPQPYQDEAARILKAMNKNLWVSASETGRYVVDGVAGYSGHWAEYKDVMGLRRVHPDAALWSIYTPIDCGVGTPRQMYSCTEYVNRFIPHIKVESSTAGIETGDIISTTDWLPYSWSINNVASAEIMHTALAFFESGRADKGYELLRANMMDQMYLGASPANFGQISYYDAARGESYRDFGDNIGISARAYLQGLFGIVPQALDGKCMIRPGFPLEWDSVEVRTPYLSYKYKRNGDKGMMEIKQSFSHPLQIMVRINGEEGDYKDYVGNADECQTVTFDCPTVFKEKKKTVVLDTAWAREIILSNEIVSSEKQCPIDMSKAKAFNANVTDIFRNEYVSPRPQSTSLEIPVQGIGEWCHPKFTVEINDSAFRAQAVNNTVTINGVTFFTPQKGNNIAFASLWDNYPDSVVINVQKPRKAQTASILLAGSTNHMQVHIDNALIIAEYADGSEDTLRLYPPYNYCPIEQDYYVDNKAFKAGALKPLRVSLSTGKASRELGTEMGIPSTEVYGRELRGGAAQVLTMCLDGTKKVKRFKLKCLSNDIVVGIMGITLG